MTRRLAAFILLLLLPVFLFVGVSVLLMLFPANNLAVPQSDTTSPAIMLTHDLAHVNVLLDLSQSTTPWDTLVPEIVPQMQGYLLVGWGDQQTYLSTPNWSDLEFTVALQALFTNTSSTLHLRYLPSLENLGVTVTALLVNDASRQKIESNILAAFEMSQGQPILLAAGYDAGDRFYVSKGSYNVFQTCNSWIGELLRHSGVPVSLWTPFSYNVIYSIPAQFRGKTL